MLKIDIFSFAVGVGFGTTLFLLSYWRHNHQTSLICTRKRIISFGASLVQFGFETKNQGWIANLADWWSRKVDIINRGLSGYNSRWANLVFDQFVLSQQPDLLFIFFGSNDLANEGSAQHVPREEYGENLKQMISRARMVRYYLLNFPIWSFICKFYRNSHLCQSY
jgi:lysophospholipase L1-like esterase